MQKRIFYDDIEHIKFLENRIDFFKGMLKRKENRLENLQNQCDHPIIAVHDLCYGYSVDANCVLCRKKFHTPYELHKIKNYYTLDFYNSKKSLSSKLNNEIIDKKMEKLFESNPYLTVEELYEELKDLL